MSRVLLYFESERRGAAYWADLEAILATSPAIMADVLGLDLDSYLGAVAKWSASAEAFPYGVRVDLQSKTIMQAGREPGAMEALKIELMKAARRVQAEECPPPPEGWARFEGYELLKIDWPDEDGPSVVHVRGISASGTHLMEHEIVGIELPVLRALLDALRAQRGTEPVPVVVYASMDNPRNQRMTVRPA